MKIPFDNRLTPAQAERLAIAAEECGELIQAIGKILRHGYDSSNPDLADGPTNTDSLLREIYDVRAAMLMLALDLPEQTDIQVDLKTLHALTKKLQWTHHQGDDFQDYLATISAT